MARTPSLTPSQAYDSCVAAYGLRGAAESAMAIDSSNRGHVRAWLIANGVPSVVARSATMAELKACWRDTTDSELHALARKSAPADTDTDSEDESDDMDIIIDAEPYVPPVPALPAPSVMPSATPDATDAAGHLAKALALLVPHNAPIDADQVVAIFDERMSGHVRRLAELERTAENNILEMIEGAPRKLEIVINDVVKGQMPALRHNRTETLLSIVAANVPAYIVGPAGSGKTTAAEQVADALSLSFYMQGAATGAHEFLGFIDAHGRYQSTPFRQAFEHGGVFLADEIDGSDPGALLIINSALANGHMAFPDSTTPIHRHADFRMIAAANTFGTGADRQYVGRSQLDAATLDRFAFLDWPYDEKLERLLSSHPDWTARVQNVRAAVAKLNLRHVVSPRASINGARMLAAGMAWDMVETLLLWKGLTPADVARVRSAV